MENEKIGGVTLDYSRYPGADYYCDGEVEGQLLDIVRELPPGSYYDAIAERRDWPTLYHLSEFRGSIVSWIPFDGTEKVLEIGAGPGAITQCLAGRVKSVECVDLSRQRSLINAWRNRERDNITIHVGNFADIEPELPCDYDYIFLIGVFEYFQHYIDAPDPFRAELARILPHLKGWKSRAAAPAGSRPAVEAAEDGSGPSSANGNETGRLVIAIENRLGLKYFAGCREDHTGKFFDGIGNYESGEAGVRTFSRPALERIFRDCGAEQYSFYYPYPDYKFTSAVYSDRRLPLGAELTENIRNFDRDRLLLFDEKMAYDGITSDGLFPLFSNSYEAVIGPELPVVYAKYSNDRAPQYRILTEFVRTEDGTVVRKKPACPEAAAHVRHLLHAYAELAKRYEGSGLYICPCHAAEDGAVCFPLIGEKSSGKPGMSGDDSSGSCETATHTGVRTLEELLDERLFRGDEEGFYSLIQEYLSRAGYHDSYPAADRDMTFANILIDEKENWTAIDYEWEKDEPMSARDLLIRALTVYLPADAKRGEKVSPQALKDRFGITPDDLAWGRKREQEIQKEVTGGRISLSAFRAELGQDVTVPEQIIREDPVLLQKAEQQAREQRKAVQSLASVQIYYDRGNGYSEKDSYFAAEEYREEGQITVEIPVEADVRALRVDPALCPCLVLPERMTVNGAEVSRFARLLSCNGRRSPDGSIVFTTHDPEMEWRMDRIRRQMHLSGERVVRVALTWQMCGLPSSMAERMAGKV